MAVTTTNTANIGFEEKIWAAADILRGNMDASEYKHVVLGLIFLKYISDTFDERYQRRVTDSRKTATNIPRKACSLCRRPLGGALFPKPRTNRKSARPLTTLCGQSKRKTNG